MSLGQLYQDFYDKVCGRHPFQYPWHSQWLPSRNIRNGLRKALDSIDVEAKVLDVGCGSSPYKQWLPAGSAYTGIDVESSAGQQDIIIEPDKPWPFENESYHTVLCTEVLEHVRDQALLLSEIERVLAPGGCIVLSVPFIYNEHGKPWDYRRFSAYGVEELLAAKYYVESVQRLGRIGTVLGTLFLNWIDASLTRKKFVQYTKPVLLPFWIPFCLFVNVIGLVLDFIDRTDECYIETLVIARKNS